MAIECALTQVFDHRFYTIEWLIARLGLRLETIAARNGLTLESWEEDGLGPAIGCLGRLPSGVVIALVEYAHAIAYYDLHGPGIYVDAVDVERHGIESLIAQALSALHLDASNVEWRNDRAPTPEEVASYIRIADESRRRKAAASSPK